VPACRVQLAPLSLPRRLCDDPDDHLSPASARGWGIARRELRRRGGLRLLPAAVPNRARRARARGTRPLPLPPGEQDRPRRLPWPGRGPRDPPQVGPRSPRAARDEDDRPGEAADPPAHLRVAADVLVASGGSWHEKPKATRPSRSSRTVL